MTVDPEFGKIGTGPVITVARDDTDGTISVGLNTGTPANVANVLREGIRAQGERIAKGEVLIRVSEDMAREGGHSEINALNPLILRRQQKLRRTLTETDLHVFEIHNIWLRGTSKGSPKGRCEHCARITRGVKVTQSIFIAEGGVVGEITIPQRGAVKRAANNQTEHVTTASGEVKVPQRGSVTRSGSNVPEEVTTASGTIYPKGRGPSGPGPVGSPSGSAVDEAIAGGLGSGMLDAGFGIVEAFFKQWYYENYLKDRYDKAAREMVQNVILKNRWWFKLMIALSMEKVLKARAANQKITLHICLDTHWTAGDMGPVQTAAEIKFYSLLFGDDKPIDPPPQSFWSELWENSISSGRVTTSRMVVDIPL